MKIADHIENEERELPEERIEGFPFYIDWAARNGDATQIFTMVDSNGEITGNYSQANRMERTHPTHILAYMKKVFEPLTNHKEEAE